MDRRFDNCPEGAVCPIVIKAPARPIFDASTLTRADGRFPEQSRPLDVQVGIVAGCSGSALLKTGNTEVLCVVYGPRPITKGSIRARLLEGLVECQVDLLPGCRPGQRIPPSTTSTSNMASEDGLQLSRLCEQALSPAIIRSAFPDAQVDVRLAVIHDDGGLLTCVINAASLALLHARIPMLDTVIGCSVSLLNGEVHLIDPAMEELSGGQLMTMALLYHSGRASLTQFKGVLGMAALQECINALIDGARPIYERFREIAESQLCQ